MAYQIRKGGGNWSTISNISDYGSIVANYASTFLAAQQVQKDVELEAKVMEYKNGQLSYSDLVQFLNNRIVGEIPGSQRELDLRKILLDAGDYEANNKREIKRAQLTERYAKGGVSAAEKLAIEQEMLKFYKKGTPEYGEQLTVIATAKELQMQEEKNDKLVELQSTLIDRYKEGGLTNEERLIINHELQKVVEPNSEDSLKLKENEASLLGEIAKEKSEGPSSGPGSNEYAGIELQRLQAEEASLRNAFAIGAISDQGEYLSQLNANLASQGDIINDVPDAESATPNLKGELINRMNELSKLNEQVKTGSAVTVKTKDGWQVTPLDEVGVYGENETVTSGDGGISNEGKVVHLMVNGEDKVFAVSGTGRLEEVAEATAQDDTGKDIKVFAKTGSVYSPAEGKITKPTATPGGVVPGTPMTATQTAGSAIMGGLKGEPYKRATSSLVKTASPTVKKTVSSAKSSVLKMIPPVVKNVVSPITSAPAGKVPGTKDFGISEKLGIKTTAGKIPGTIDFGVTEAVSAAAKKAKNALSNLFSRR